MTEGRAVVIRVQDKVVLFARLPALVWRRRSREHAIPECESPLLIRYGGGPEAQMLVMATHGWSCDGQAEADTQVEQATSSPDPVQPCRAISRLPRYGHQENGFGGETRMAAAVNKLQHNWQSTIPHTSCASTCRKNQHPRATRAIWVSKPRYEEDYSSPV